MQALLHLAYDQRPKLKGRLSPLFLAGLLAMVFNAFLIASSLGAHAQTAPSSKSQADEKLIPSLIESIEADVSTRRVAVTAGFTGSEIIVFGTIVNGELNTRTGYDVIVVVDGTHAPLVARRKSRVAGIWINTEAVEFRSLPSYYAITSTRPISQIAPRDVLKKQGIGFSHVVMVPTPEDQRDVKTGEMEAFKDAVVRIKKRESLYLQDDQGVTFIGQSLFRSSITLPANVPVGPLTARVYLFRDGRLLARHESSVSLQREGIERILHTFAFDYPFYYGVFAVFLAVFAGLAASALFQRVR